MMRIENSDRIAIILLAATSLIVFAPLLSGNFLLGGTDVQWNHYPNLLFGYDEFRRHGALSLWNPHIFAGTDMSGSMHAHYLNPLYWPLFLLPRNYLFHGLTALFLGFNFVTGLSWFLLGRHKGLKSPAAFLVGLVSSAGMFSWFVTTTMIAVPMYAFSSAAIALICTADRRSKMAQFLALSIAFAFILITAHPAYILGFGLPIVAALLVTEYPNWWRRPWAGQTLTVLAAGFLGLSLSLYRVFPTLVEVITSGSFIEGMWLPSILNHGFFVLTTFNPLALGIDTADASVIANALGLGHTRHTQMHNGLYFGVVPLIVALIALFLKARRTVAALWVVFLVLLLTPLYFNQQLSDIVNLLFFPAIHDATYRILAQFAFLALLLVALKSVDTVPQAAFDRAFTVAAVIVGGIFSVELIMWLRVMQVGGNARFVSSTILVNVFRVSLILVLALTAFFAFRVRLATAQQALKATICIGAALPVFLLLLLATRSRYMLDPVVLYTLLDIGVALSAAVVLAWMPSLVTKDASNVRWIVGAIGTVAVLALAFHFQAEPAGRSARTAFMFALAGTGKLLIVAALAFLIVRLWGSGLVSVQRAMWLLAAICALDLLGAIRVYSFVNTSTPFVGAFSLLYPERQPAADLAEVAADMESGRSGANLLRNPAFDRQGDSLPAWTFGGGETGICPKIESPTWQAGRPLALCAAGSSSEMPSLYQDIPVKSVKSVSFGAWLQVQPGGSAAIFVTSPTAARGSPAVQVPADGRWHWIQVSLETSALPDVRPHIVFRRGVSIGVYAPRLVGGPAAAPAANPEYGEWVEPPKTPTVDPAIAGRLDLYRVNRPTRFLNLYPVELIANYAQLYGLRTYGGADSDMPRRWSQFLFSFVEQHPAWYHRAGIAALLDHGRLLDLLGVGVDVLPSGAPYTRPDTVPRLAAFPLYEMHGSDKEVLARLKSSDFDPLSKLVLEHQPSQLVHDHKFVRALPLEYSTPAADVIEVRVKPESPRLIFFGDKYSPHWRATWNGVPIDVLRANFMFMAVAVPEGNGVLRFEFVSTPFVRALRLSLLSAVLLGALALVYLAVVLRYRIPRSDRP